MNGNRTRHRLRRLPIPAGLAVGAVFMAVTATAQAQNHSPTARVAETQIFLTSLGDAAALDASPSFDPDGDTLLYSWREHPANPVLGLVPAASHSLSNLHLDFPAPGRYRFDLQVSDGRSASETTEAITVYVPGLQGVVRLAESMARVPDVTVAAFSNATDAAANTNAVDVDISDSRGRFTLENTTPASTTNSRTYTIKLTRTNFLDTVTDRTVMPDPEPGAEDGDLSIGRDSVSLLRGTVEDGETGRLLSGVRVYLEGKERPTDTFGGEFWFLDVRQGSWSMQFYKAGYRPEVRDINVSTNWTNTVINLTPATGSETGELAGRATLAGADRPVRDATLSLGAGTWQYQAHTDDDGMYRFADLPIGSYTLTVERERFETLRTPSVNVAPGTNALDVGLFLAPPGPVVSGLVLDDVDGRPVRFATATAGGVAGLSPWNDLSDPTGFFELRDVPTGEHDLRIGAPGYTNSTLRVAVEGSVTNVTVRLGRAPWWSDPADVIATGLVARLSPASYYLGGLGQTITLSATNSQGSDLRYIWRESPGNPQIGLLSPGDTDPEPEIAGFGRPGIYVYELQVRSGTNLSANTAVATVFVPGLVGTVCTSPSDGLDPLELVSVALYATHDDASRRRNEIASALSGEDGAFAIGRTGLSTGAYWLAADTVEPGYQPYGPVRERITYSSSMRPVRINLARNPCAINGDVTDQDTGDPLEGVRVLIAPGPMSETFHTSTDANGDFHLSDVPDGERVLLLVKDGYASRSVWLQLPIPPIVPLNVTMDPANASANISGRVMVSYSDVALPVPGAEITLGGGLFRTFTDGAGYFEIENLPPGDHSGFVRKEGYRIAHLGGALLLHLAPGPNEDVDTTLAFDGTGPVIRGYLVDADGAPVTLEGVTVTVLSAESDDATNAVPVDAGGVFQIAGVPRSEVRLRLRYPNGCETIHKVHLSDGGEIAQEQHVLVIMAHELRRKTPEGAEVEVFTAPDASTRHPFLGDRFDLPLDARHYRIGVRAADGYWRAESPAERGQPDAPENMEYGNPRAIDLQRQRVSFTFGFVAMAQVGGMVRDDHTHARIADAVLEFHSTADPMIVYTGYQNTAWSPRWRSRPGGELPDDAESGFALLPTGTYSLVVSANGYHAVTTSVNATARAATNVLPDIELAPVDVNTNGFSDQWEILSFGTVTNVDPHADPDGDGWSNHEEYLRGTHPTSAQDGQLWWDDHGAPGLSWTAYPGIGYDIEVRDSLTAGTWRKACTRFVPNRTAGNPPTSLPIDRWTDTNAVMSTQRFYRIDREDLR
jgi:hypothetical protein